jgi:pimeloyl-[acyl-carrier protein] methyl ester esterase
MSLQLHVSSQGSGPDMVLVHGWGMHSGIWQTVVKQLQEHHRVHCVDLPGHGASTRDGEQEFALPELLESLVVAVRPALAGPACWVGWSLGGMIAAHVAERHPELVRKLVMVAASLRFSRHSDWPHGVATDVLEGFAAELHADHNATLQRFLALQVQGEKAAHSTLRQLKQQVLAIDEPSEAALQSGLVLLQEMDLRADAGSVVQPVLLIGGEHDRLVSPQALPRVSSLFRNARAEVISDAGHAPFVSQPDKFVQLVETFCRDV